MYLTYSEGKSAVAERFIKILKNKIYQDMTSLSKNVYIDKLFDIVNKYSNTYHSKIKMKLVDVKLNTYIDFILKILKKIPDLKLVTMKVQSYFYENITFKIGLRKFLSLKKLKVLFRKDMLLVVLMMKELLERFKKKNCKKRLKENLECKK